MKDAVEMAPGAAAPGGGAAEPPLGPDVPMGGAAQLPRRSVAPEAALPELARPEPISELPIVILFPHSRCNCRCLMCDIWRDPVKRELSTAEVAEWCGEWRRLGVRQVVLSGGEALLHSDLWEICERLREAGIAITLLSTGLLLARDAPRVARYCAEVIVSLDGPAAVHNLIRNLPRAYEKLAGGVAALRGTAPGLPVGARCTVQRQNFRHLRATVAAARELGVDWLSFLAADISTDAFNRPRPWEPGRVAEVALADDELPELAAELAALESERAEDFASGFIVEGPAKLRRRLHGYYAALRGRGDFPANRCNAPWVSTVIEADGTVRPCFFQPPLGNLRQAGSLAAILNSPAASAWRRGLDVRTDPICRKCVCTLALEPRSEPGDVVPLGRPAGGDRAKAPA
jgi:MoaA/NifB/PqqE/SkfB family radical SAM enzyme